MFENRCHSSSMILFSFSRHLSTFDMSGQGHQFSRINLVFPEKVIINKNSKPFLCLQTLFLGSCDTSLFPKVLVLRASRPPGKLYGSLAWARGGSVGRSPLQQYWPNCEQSGELRLEKNGFENSSCKENHNSYVLFV